MKRVSRLFLFTATMLVSGTPAAVADTIKVTSVEVEGNVFSFIDNEARSATIHLGAPPGKSDTPGNGRDNGRVSEDARSDESKNTAVTPPGWADHPGRGDRPDTQSLVLSAPMPGNDVSLTEVPRNRADTPTPVAEPPAVFLLGVGLLMVGVGVRLRGPR